MGNGSSLEAKIIKFICGTCKVEKSYKSLKVIRVRRSQNTSITYLNMFVIEDVVVAVAVTFPASKKKKKV
jgi:hypothetical protein